MDKYILPDTAITEFARRVSLESNTEKIEAILMEFVQEHFQFKVEESKPSRPDFECHVYEDDYGIEISTNEVYKDHTISLNTAEDVRCVMDACKKWLDIFAPQKEDE